MPDSGGSPQSRPPWPPRRRQSLLPRSEGKSAWGDVRNILLSFLLVTVLGASITAYFQHQNDVLKALDDNREATLQAYISNMRDLLQNQKSTSPPPGNARQVARAQTLNTLRFLDADRNKIVFQFLRDEGLIRAQDPVIDLRNADLSNDNLSGVNLSDINLNGATMIGAHLNGANMSGDSLWGTDLSNTDLSDADLSRTFMFDAQMNDARLNGADLSYATLSGAFLGGTNMNDATLTGAHLNGAILTGAQLTDAHLSDANLLNADLTDAKLSGADLSDADLVSNLKQQQLDQVSSCADASLSKGISCQPICAFEYTVLICQPKAPVQLTYWYTESPAETPVICKLIGQFEQENPGIKVNTENTNYFNAEAKFTNVFKEGSAPDILRSDVGWVAQFASQGYLLDISPFINLNINPHINPYIRVRLSDYLSTPLSYDYYNSGLDNGLYGLPQVTDFLALLYNKKEVRKAEGTIAPPATMDKFKTYAEDVVRQGAARYGFETDGASYDTLPFLYAFGGGMLDQHGNIIVNHDGSMKGLEFLVGLEHDSKAQVMPTNVNFINGPPGPVISDFANGKTAMIFGGPYNIPDILAGGSFKDPRNLGIAPIPGCPARTATCRAGQPGSPSGGQSYVISAHTAHPVEAYKFIAFMSSERSQIAIAKNNQTLPTLKNAYQDNGVKDKQFISEFCGIAYTAIARPAIPQSGHLFDVFDPHIAAALAGVESPPVALNAVADAWKQLLPNTAVTPSGVSRVECRTSS